MRLSPLNQDVLQDSSQVPFCRLILPLRTPAEFDNETIEGKDHSSKNEDA